MKNIDKIPVPKPELEPELKPQPELKLQPKLESKTDF